MTEEMTALSAHRERLSQAKNFQEYQEAELDFIDFILATHKGKDRAEYEALAEYSAKYNEWATK